MGQVYRARDTKLNRDIALKILPDAFSADGDRIARFRREAQVLAALNHSNIAHIYGFEDSGSTHALVLELVEGPTLADRIAKGPIPLDEALPIAKQIVEALEAAHEQGIIHRDLKPANIKLRDDGTVKVLDFGLAKALEPASAISPTLTASPTITTPAQMTHVGMILGTAAYMSPEQAKGRPADKRSDIWAFGCVLFEMLTGTRAFEGEDVSDTLAAVLRGEPDWNALPAGTPPVVHRLLRRCLAKDPRERLRDIGDVRFDLAEATTPASSIAVTAAPTAIAGATSRALARVIIPWGVAAALAVVTIAVLAVTRPWRAPEAPVPMTLNAELGTDVSLSTAVGASAALSPDGQTLAFVATGPEESTAKLYLRRLDHLTATVLAGTDDAAGPFFSPDGQWIAFFAGGKLKKISVTGGAPVTLADASNARGGSWGDDNIIVF